MNDALQQHGHCLLPGIGLLHIIRNPAERSYQENKLYPPSFDIILDTTPPLDKSFFSITQQIAYAHALSMEEAEKEWLKTATAIKNKLSTGSSITLKGLGLFNLDEEGRISFVFPNQSFPLYDTLSISRQKEPKKPEIHLPDISAEKNDIHTEETKVEGGLIESHVGKTIQRQPKSRWWIIGSIIALLLVGWFTYKGTMQRREKASTFRKIIKKDNSVPGLAVTDSLKLQSDSVQQQQAMMNDSIRYKIVFAVYNNKDKAVHQFHRMRSWGHPVVLITRDSGTYELAMPFTSLPNDTTVNLVKMMKLYGGKVHIEYDAKE